MAYKRKSVSYRFESHDKASMIMVLEQFGEELTTIRELKNMLMVDGSIVLDSHYAVLLARLMYPHYEYLSKQLLAPLETYPHLSPPEHQLRYYELVNR